MQKKRYKDITGNKFGKLIVTGIDPEHKKYPQKFIANCECGNISSYFSFSLTSGKTKNCKNCGRLKTQKVTNSVLIESYSRLNNIWLVADEVGLCGQSVNERLIKLGVQHKMNYFSDEDVFFIREHYMDYLLRGKLSELAKKMGRTKSLICKEAAKLGLTDISRKKKLLENFKPNITEGHWKRLGKHPVGMKGKKHKPETIALLSIINKENQRLINLDADKRLSITKKTLETKHKSGVFANARPHTTWKSGWREIGGKRKYFRSRWEANYARYLEFLKVQKQISEWEHEPEVFWFDGIKRGCVSYLPDFRVTELNGSFTYHEVKGWMDDRSKTKIKRMEIYHPEIKLLIIDAKWFKANNKKLSPIIKGWETNKK